MKYMKEIAIIFGVTLAGEILHALLPLPVPVGVYGLFLLLALLCSGRLRLPDVEHVGGLLLDLMPVMFIPAAAGLMESAAELRAVLVPFLTITFVSTLFVMTVTGRVAEAVLKGKKEEGR